MHPPFTLESPQAFKLVAEEMLVEPLLAALERVPDQWNTITARQDDPDSPHGATRTILLRGPESLTREAAQTDLVCLDFPAYGWLPDARVLIERLSTLVGGGIVGRAMLVDLPAGSEIAEHADEGRYAEFYDRFHIVLQSENGNVFRCGDQVQHLRPGTAWWFNHRLSHHVVNDSQSRRIHLIVDMLAPAYRALRGGAAHVSDVTYQRELVHGFWNECRPLLEKHYREIATYQDIPLAPDDKRYHAVEESGDLRCYTARDAAGTMLGYAVYFVQTNMHYSTSLQARQDVLFVDPKARGRTGMRLIEYSHQMLRAEGVQVVTQHVKAAHDFGPRLLAPMGYEVQDVVWSKRLDR